MKLFPQEDLFQSYKIANLEVDFLIRSKDKMQVIELNGFSHYVYDYRFSTNKFSFESVKSDEFIGNHKAKLNFLNQLGLKHIHNIDWLKLYGRSKRSDSDSMRILNNLLIN